MLITGKDSKLNASSDKCIDGTIPELDTDKCVKANIKKAKKAKKVKKVKNAKRKAKKTTMGKPLRTKRTATERFENSAAEEHFDRDL
eukprot:COSAG01_NODE_1019_length_12097_cov_7.650942_9_plen_87_part_00